jgi:hypothetical protein
LRPNQRAELRNGVKHCAHVQLRLAYVAALIGLCTVGDAAIGSDNATEDATSERICHTLNVRSDARPDTDGHPTEVTVGVRVIDITRIDDLGQSINTDFAIRQSWIDPRLTRFEGCKFAVDQVWIPQVAILNSAHLWPELRDYVEVGPLGRVVYLQRYHGAVVFTYQAHDFPFDEQEVVLSFLSMEYGVEEVVLVNDEKFTGRIKGDFKIPDWEIGAVFATVESMYVDAYGTNHSRLDIELTAKRHARYFIWKAMFPLILIVAMSWSVFWVHPARFGPQIGLSATSMLTLIAFLFATQAIVPRLNYLTIMDKFVLGSTALVFLALVEAVTTAYWIAKDREAAALHTDRVCRWIFPAAFIGLILVLYIEK